jgi:pyruvate,water dikinase
MIITSQASESVGIDTLGGKAMSLMSLTRRGFRVPPFFVIAADELKASQSGKVSDELRSQVAQALVTIGGAEFDYAVRSSGLAEDSAEFSFAGVFETILGVRGEDAIVAAIEKCWASHGGPVAAAYRSRRGVSDDVSMAVIIQRLVHSEWAGVSFSADPLTQALSVCVINGHRGIGEELVSGRVNPHEIRIEVGSGRVLSDFVPPGAQPLPAEIREQVLHRTLEASESFGFPQDLEWATEEGELFLLQSRPISTIDAVFHNRALEPWLGAGNPDDTSRVWTRAYADEVWSSPLSPLFYDIQNLTVVTGQQLRNSGDAAPVPVDVFKYYRAAAYMDAAVLVRLYATLPPFARRPSLFDLLPPDFRPQLATARWNWLGTVARLWKFEVRQGRTRGLTRNHRFLEAAWPAFLVEARRLSDVDLEKLEPGQLDKFLLEVWALALSVAPECEVAVLYYAHDLRFLLSGLLARWCGKGESLYAEVSSGLEHSHTVRESEEIWQMAAAIASAAPGICETAVRSDWDGFRSQRDDQSVNSIVSRFEEFLREHRHRGANYKDLIYPRWGDDPDLLWGHVKALLGKETPRPSEANARGRARRIAAQKEALTSMRGWWRGPKRLVLRMLFRLNEIYSGLRDNHRFYYDYVWWLVRRVYLEKGRRLTDARLLSKAEDVMYLARVEIDALQSGELSRELASARIVTRQREWHAARLKPSPRFLRRGYLADEQSKAASLPSRQLRGLPASPGTARGRARVVLDVAELTSVAEGEVLVTRQTDPGWTPVFARLAGLVLETGGVLAHGASLCREYGLPCVTAVEGATSSIRDGDIIAISGSEGTVELV